MESTPLSNCKNCGAKLDITKDSRKCTYCGSEFTDPIPREPQPIVHLQTFQHLTNRPANQTVNEPNNGCIGYVVIAAIALLGLILVIRSSGELGNRSTVADSIRTDTSTAKLGIGTNGVKTEEDTTIKATLKKLATISIDVKTFKKLYSNAYKKHDQFSGNTDIYDKTSPQYVNISGIFAYISKEDNSYKLSFTTQYTGDDWLFIDEIIVNTDGNVSHYSPTFKRDNGKGGVWEWSDETVPDETLPMLAGIANSKKAMVRYNGDKYYKIVKITHVQQAAMKRQLQIFKGLLLGYNSRINRKNGASQTLAGSDGF
jgi:hypothetical protein